MTADQLRAARERLGLKIPELASLLRYNDGGRALRHYEAGTRPVPRLVSIAVDLLDWLPPVDRAVFMASQGLRKGKRP